MEHSRLLPFPVALRRTLSENLAEQSIEFGVPAYNEGKGVVETLASIHHAAQEIGVPNYAIILSDSSVTRETVEAAGTWATLTGVRIRIDRSEQRRSPKEALNNIFDLAEADALVLVDADVLIPSSSLAHLLFDLIDPPPPDIAVGSAGPDPAFRALRYRASIWQMNVTRRVAARRPRKAIRSEGAFWGTRKAFYRAYRFPIGTGSIADDVELARHARREGLHVRNSWRAEARKKPAGSLEDFYIQTYRSYAASGGLDRRPRDLRDVFLEASSDPLGALMYLLSRGWAWRRARRRPDAFEERWLVAESTKRRR
ncbi:MAG: glycosyltransferase [bacterium]